MERILVVDNDESARFALGAVLESQGFGVEVAAGGLDALKRLDAETRFDLIVSDIQMPGMNGIELARRIVKADPTLVTILVTGFRDQSMVLEAMRAGAFDFLWKPYTVTELNQALVRARDRRKQLVGNERYQVQLERRVQQRDSELTVTHRILAELQSLAGNASEPDQVTSSLKEFAQFALRSFDLSSFGLLILGDQGLESLVFEDRYGRIEDRSVLAAGSDLSGAVAENAESLRRPPSSWNLQKENRFAGYWPIHNDLFAGVMYAGSEHDPEVVSTRHSTLFRLFASRIDGFLREHYLMRRHLKQQRSQFVSSIQAHARAIEAKDPYTAGHCDRVERYTTILAQRAGTFSGHSMFNLRVGAILHDIGKIGVPSALLCKPGILSPDEERQVREHPVIGGRIVRSLDGFDLEPLIRHHHERFDGEGYPDRLKGDRIPLEARLVLAADTFDAMTSNRPYRRALTTERALEELQQFTGEQFDPEVVKLMNAAASELEIATHESSESLHRLGGLADAV
jgi:response regulator RpfG family c-di-GMP phosphodiesterase